MLYQHCNKCSGFPQKDTCNPSIILMINCPQALQHNRFHSQLHCYMRTVEWWKRAMNETATSDRFALKWIAALSFERKSILGIQLVCLATEVATMGMAMDGNGIETKLSLNLTVNTRCLAPTFVQVVCPRIQEHRIKQREWGAQWKWNGIIVHTIEGSIIGEFMLKASEFAVKSRHGESTNKSSKDWIIYTYEWLAVHVCHITPCCGMHFSFCACSVFNVHPKPLFHFLYSRLSLL